MIQPTCKCPVTTLKRFALVFNYGSFYSRETLDTGRDLFLFISLKEGGIGAIADHPMKYRVISPEVISAEVEKPPSKLYLSGSV